MTNWQKIPPTKLITVSARKWARLKASVDWKLDRELKEERAAHKRQVAALAAERIRLELSLQHALDSAVKWMEKYESLKPD